MKHILLTTIAAVLLVGCGESQQSAPAPESKPVEPVAEAAKTDQSPVKTPNISIHAAVRTKNIVAVKQHLAAGTDVNAKFSKWGWTPLHYAAGEGHKEIAELLIAKGADVNVKVASGAKQGLTPLDAANERNHPETAALLRKHGGKTGAELKAEGK